MKKLAIVPTIIDTHNGVNLVFQLKTAMDMKVFYNLTHTHSEYTSDWSELMSALGKKYPEMYCHTEEYDGRENVIIQLSVTASAVSLPGIAKDMIAYLCEGWVLTSMNLT